MSLIGLLDRIGLNLEDWIDNLCVQTMQPENANGKVKTTRENTWNRPRPGEILAEQGQVKLDSGKILEGTLIYNGNALKEEDWIKSGKWLPGMFKDRRVVIFPRPAQKIYVTFVKNN